MTTALSRAATAALALAAWTLLAGCASRVRACESPYAASPQFKDCGFSNPPNPDALPSAGSWKIWSRFLLEAKTGTVPTDPIPVQALDGAQLGARSAGQPPGAPGPLVAPAQAAGPVLADRSGVRERASPFQWLGPRRFHPPPIALEKLPPIAGLILSHDHYDHLDTATIGYLAQRVQRYFVPLGVKARLVELGVPAERVTELDWWQQAQFDGVELTATPAQHFSGRTLNDRDRTLWASWVIQSGGQRIFYSGDSGYFKGFREIGERFGGFDLAMMENGAYDAYWPAVRAMTPEQSVQAFDDLRGKVLFSRSTTAPSTSRSTPGTIRWTASPTCPKPGRSRSPRR